MASLEEPRLTSLILEEEGKRSPAMLPYRGSFDATGLEARHASHNYYVGARLSVLCSSPLAEAHCDRRNQIRLIGGAIVQKQFFVNHGESSFEYLDYRVHWADAHTTLLTRD